ncbi:Zn-dependent exopeptidase M28 [bacterium]|nr:Zn-dependent exopeptidase M28 [bacterium]
MSRFLNLSSILLLALTISPSAEPLPDAQRLMGTVETLASPAFQGRLLGSPGGLSAQEWLRDEAAASGLLPLAGWDVPVQTFQVRGYRWMNLKAALRGPREMEFELILKSDGPLPRHRGALKHWDDTDAAPLCAAHEVLFRDFNPGAGESPSDLLDEAARAGAGALILLPHPDDERGLFARYRMRSESGDLAVHYLPGSEARPILFYGSLELREALAQNLEGWHLELPEVEAFSTQGDNLLYRLPESQAGSIVLLVAHYDHLGPAEGGYHPGANDNGSGVAVLLETARLLAQRQYPFELRFLFSDGEEEVMLGARAYLAEMEDPELVINLDTVGRAGVNHYRHLRDPSALDPELLMLWSEDDSAAAEALESLASNLEFHVERGHGPIFERAGDHFPFAQAGVPALFIFGGFHAGYHQPQDTADLVLPDKLVKLCELLRDFLDSKAKVQLENQNR